jgi:PmbA protein
MRPPIDTEAVLASFDAALDGSTADQLELCLLGRAGEYTRFATDRIHQPQDVTETQILVRAVVDGRARRAAVTVLRDVAAAVTQATDSARRAANAQGAGSIELAEPGPSSGENALWFDDVSGFDAAARSHAARTVMRHAVSAGADAAGMFGRAITQQVVATSTGIRRVALATEAHGSLTVRAGEGSAHWLDVGRGLGRLDVAESTAATVSLAEAARSPVPLPAGEYTVVLGAEAVGELLQFLPAFGFAGDVAAAGIGLCATRAGEQVAADSVHVADDATADVGLPIGFDIEGSVKQRVPLLDGGRVGAPVTDLATARKLGTASTGHAHIAREQAPTPEAANIVMAAGTSTEQELIAGVDDGVYVQRFWYTRVVDAARGTITGVTRDACFRIRRGVLAEPIAGTRFTQSVLDVLAAVDGIGAERRSQPTMNVWNGAVSAPALRSHGFRLGVRRES